MTKAFARQTRVNNVWRERPRQTKKTFFARQTPSSNLCIGQVEVVCTTQQLKSFIHNEDWFFHCGIASCRLFGRRCFHRSRRDLPQGSETPPRISARNYLAGRSSLGKERSDCRSSRSFYANLIQSPGSRIPGQPKGAQGIGRRRHYCVLCERWGRHGRVGGRSGRQVSRRQRR